MRATGSQHDAWASGDVYDPYIGRWSRLVAAQFLPWLSVPAGSAWLDVGCGTGALSHTILDMASPRSVKGIDRSASYLDFARSRIHDSRASFEPGDAQNLPVASDACDAAVSALVLNFVPDHAAMLHEMMRAVRPGGRVALYVWDYADKMQLMRHFWNAAAALDPAAYDLDEGRRSPICNPDALLRLFESSGLSGVEVMPIDVDTRFKDFDDYWTPFMGGQGPAPTYAMSLTEAARGRLRERLRDALPFAVDGSLSLVARAWSVKGLKS